MASLIPGFEYDIFISYRQKDNKGEHWVTEFVNALRTELESTFKEDISIYFDENPHDGLHEHYDVTDSLKEKLKCFIFIPIISQTYCDPNSFAWKNEFLAFKQIASEDPFGLKVKLQNGNVASRILPVRIHGLDEVDRVLLESELGSIRCIEFIFSTAGVNRPLRCIEDHPNDNLNHTFFRDQINKTANAIKEILTAWMAPEKKEHEALKIYYPRSDHPHPSKTPRLSKKRTAVTAIILTLLLVVGYGLFNSIIPIKNSAAVIDKSIAVLSFKDLSSLHDQEYLSDGIADEIHNRLCKFNDLTVAAMTSSFSFKDKNEDIKTIGKKLNVANILEGTVRKDENKIIITIRLTNATSGFTVMTQSYEGELKNIFSLQQNIAIDIAEKIESKLAPQEIQRLTRKEVNPKAYENYLKGRSQFLNGPIGQNAEIFNAKKYFEVAVSLDSTFAEAYAYLSLTYFNFADWAAAKSKRKFALDSARLMAEKALSLDPNNSGAHLAMGSWYVHQYKWIEAEEEKRKAVELNPGGAEEKFILASFLSQFGQTSEALQLDKEAIRLDPLDPNNNIKYARDLYRAGNYDECIRQCNHVLMENPNSSAAYQFLGWCYWGKQQYPEALEAWAKLQELLGHHPIAEIFETSDFKSAMLALTKLDESNPLVYALAKDKENTIKYLNIAYENHESLTNLRFEPVFDFIRNDPRFLDLYEKAGFKEYDNYKEGVKK